MNIVPFKGRDPYDATRVAVFRNLHARAWSLVANDGRHKGQVVAHARSVQLDLPIFRVSEAGRQRVIREQQKNVHAFVVGILRDTTEYPDDLGMERVTYNPYTMSEFRLAEDGTPIPAARVAIFDDQGKLWAA